MQPTAIHPTGPSILMIGIVQIVKKINNNNDAIGCIGVGLGLINFLRNRILDISTNHTEITYYFLDLLNEGVRSPIFIQIPRT